MPYSLSHAVPIFICVVLSRAASPTHGGEMFDLTYLATVNNSFVSIVDFSNGTLECIISAGFPKLYSNGEANVSRIYRRKHVLPVLLIILLPEQRNVAQLYNSAWMALVLFRALPIYQAHKDTGHKRIEGHGAAHFLTFPINPFQAF